MDKKHIIITGASRGIGRETAIALKAKGWQPVLVGRSEDRLKALANSLDAPYYVADFAKLEEVAALGQSLLRGLPRVDVLANNAGGMFTRGARTEDGFETTFQVNHLAHFLLTRLLLDRLLQNKGRVINTSSIAHKALVLRYNSRHPDRPFLGSAHLAYGNAKLANILFTRELHRRYHQAGLSAAAFHPGIVLTDFSKNTRSPMRIAYTRGTSRFMRMKSPREGADTLVFLAEGQPGRDWQSGGYYADQKLSRASRRAESDRLALSLWEMSEAACKAYLSE